MFVQANNLSEIKAYFDRELSDRYSSRELRTIVKELTMNRFSLTNSDYLSFGDRLLSESDLLYYHQALKKLRNNEPFQYVMGECWFCDLSLKIDERALIPRPETEELVRWISDEWQGKSFEVLDLCSGSGCVALGLKHLNPKAKVTAFELSHEALELIKENAQLTNLDIDVVEGDALNLSLPDKASFDVWVSNPPYIPESDKAAMQANVLEFEPHMALFVSDDDPLVFYREIAQKALVYLKDGGELYFEIHEDLSKPLVLLLESLGFVNIEVRKDLQQKDRMMKALKVSSRYESNRG